MHLVTTTWCLLRRRNKLNLDLVLMSRLSYDLCVLLPEERESVNKLKNITSTDERINKKKRGK